MTCEKKDAIPIKNQLVSLKNRNERIAQRATERTKQMQTALRESEYYFQIADELSSFVDATVDQIAKNSEQEASSGDRIREQLDAHHGIEAKIQEKQALFLEAQSAGRSLIEQAPNAEKRELVKQNDELKSKWSKMEEVALKR
jgi:hypothetical protein